MQAHWHYDTSMTITNLSGTKDSIHDRQINQVEKHNDEERKKDGRFLSLTKKLIISFCHMLGTKKKYTQNMTNVETLPTKKFEMSKLKLIIAGLSL